MAEIAKLPLSDGRTEWVGDIYVIREKMNFKKINRRTDLQAI